MIYLITGACGVGKTWVMRKLFENAKFLTFKLGIYFFNETDNSIIVGKYDGTMFEGSDRLSMAVMTDLSKMMRYIQKVNKPAIFEGDRFTNSIFIDRANPQILRINGDGKAGRLKRGSKQSKEHLQRIATRVANIKPHIEFNTSTDCLNYLKSQI